MRLHLQHHSGPNVAITGRVAGRFEDRQRSIAFATIWRAAARSALSRFALAVSGLLLLPALALAQPPWERAAANLERSFTGPLARSLALVAIVIGGLMFMFGEGGSKRQIAGIAFGGGLALFATQFLAWLF